MLDAGCGSGRVTRLLLERLPRGSVVAVDASPSMVAQAREALGDRAKVVQVELTELVLDEPVDASSPTPSSTGSATTTRCSRDWHAALRPGGRLSAQCGGAGNVERFHGLAREVAEEAPFAAHLGGWTGPWNFAGAEETAARLERAGFTDVRTWLEPAPVVPEHTAEYLRTVCLGHHLERLPEQLRAPYVDAVAERCGQPAELDYVRLNIVAARADDRRSPASGCWIPAGGNLAAGGCSMQGRLLVDARQPRGRGRLPARLAWAPADRPRFTPASRPYRRRPVHRQLHLHGRRQHLHRPGGALRRHRRRHRHQRLRRRLLPLGTPVEINGASRPGTLAYSSWIAMQQRGETNRTRARTTTSRW